MSKTYKMGEVTVTERRPITYEKVFTYGIWKAVVTEGEGLEPTVEFDCIGSKEFGKFEALVAHSEFKDLMMILKAVEEYLNG